MTDEARVYEIDLQAYVDGLLDTDLERKAEVERYLCAHPLEAARVHAYRTQADALRQAYGPRALEPVPERLLALLDAAPVPSWGPRVRAAAVVVAALAAGVAGWALGQSGREAAWSAREFLEQSHSSFVNAATEPASAPGPPSMSEPEPLGWLSQQLSLNWRAPDLTDFGFSAIDSRMVGEEDARMVRLLYESADGHSFALFLRPRWKDHDPTLSVLEEGGLVLVHWLDGPLASAVVARLPAEQTVDIARAARQAMRSPPSLPPALHSAETALPSGQADPAHEGLGMEQPPEGSAATVAPTIAN